MDYLRKWEPEAVGDYSSFADLLAFLRSCFAAVAVYSDADATPSFHGRLFSSV